MVMALTNKASTKYALKRIKKLIENENNWASGILNTGDGRYCLIGAAAQVCEGNAHLAYHGQTRLLTRVYNALVAVAPAKYKAMYKPAHRVLYDFNDDERHAAVINLIDKAIERA